MKTIYFDDCFSISTKSLRKRGFFEEGSLKFTDLEFESAGEAYSVRAVVSMADVPRMVLRIRRDGKESRVNVELIARHNTLGGTGWKFACPHTGAGCYKLYFLHGVVGSRSHFKLLDRCQVKSNRIKDLDKRYGIIFKADEALAEINSKGFKKRRNGKRTKRYRRLLEIIERAKDVSLDGIL